MKHPFLLWLALLFGLMTATSQATHLKGGSLTWEPVSSTSTTFSVRAKVLLNYDLSDSGITGATGPEVKGKNTYLVNDIVVVNVGFTKIYWGDENPSIPHSDAGLNLEGPTSRFRVVKVDEAAQIITVEPAPLNPNILVHPYTGSEGDSIVMSLEASLRDSEEVFNRDGVMRLESKVKLALAAPLSNSPPAFTFDEVDNPVVVVRSSTATFEVPVAIDPDNATTPTDEITYRFVESEGEATQGSSGTPWEEGQGLTIAKDPLDGKWKVSWDTSGYGQTAHTFALQVVAEDRPVGDPEAPAKSKATMEFQVWINDPNQDGVPEIAIAPNFSTLTAVPGSRVDFRIIGTDVDETGKPENSRLRLLFDPGELPPGAAITPTGGFAGEDNDNEGGEEEGHHSEDGRMVSVFSWIPQSTDVNTQYVMHFKVEDEDTHQSTEKAVTINVVSGTTPAALQLAVTNGTDDGHHVRVVGEPGEALTFTVTGSCATAGVDLLLYTEDELPGSAVMTPELPTGGTGSATSVFTWTPGVNDLTPSSRPHEVTFIVGDEYGRELMKTVQIFIFPAAPTITLAAGETTPVTKETWKNLSFRYVVTGHGTLDITPEVGAVDRSRITAAPHTGTLTWRVLPGQLTDGTIEVTVSDIYNQVATLSVPVTVVPTTVPAWWATRGVLTGGDSDDYAVATQGQLKAIATKAYAEMLAADSSLPTLEPEGAALAAYISGFSSEEGNYNPLLQGQLKHGAKLFHEVIARKTGKHLGLPWTEEDANDDRHYAPANLGQVKALFSFPLPLSALFNDLPLVTLDTPIHGQTATAPATFELTATASDPDGSITGVTFYNGTTALHTDTTSPYSYSWTGVTLGSYNITARATDNRGAETTSSVATVSSVPVPDLPPQVIITSPTANQIFTTNPANITITATVTTDDSPITNIRFYRNGVPIGDPKTGAGTHTVTDFNVTTTGANELKVVAWDGAGRSGEARVNITMPAPTPNTSHLTLRNGLNNYTGTEDTMIRNDRARADFSGHTWMRVDRGYPDSSALLRWDLTDVPANLNLKRVKLVFRVWGKSDKTYEIYASRRYWAYLGGSGACWREYTYNKDWTTSGAKDTATDRENVVLGTLHVPEETEGAVDVEVELNEAGVNKVKEWIADSTTGNYDAGYKNYGFIIQDYSGANDKGLDLGSAEHDLNYRPAMKLYYE